MCSWIKLAIIGCCIKLTTIDNIIYSNIKQIKFYDQWLTPVQLTNDVIAFGIVTEKSVFVLY